MTVSSVARQWQQAGFSTIPILPNATKRPAVKWAEYQVRIPEAGELQGWWENGIQYGVALVMGGVSGGAEMLELEAAANEPGILQQLAQACDEAGVGDIWDLITGEGSYTELSPSGGLHIIYRIRDHEVPGNEKIAADESRHVLAETRGEGGYVIVAPSPGLCHPTGKPWEALQGEPGQCFSITWDERCKIHAAIRHVLDESPDRLPVPVVDGRAVQNQATDRSGRPGDDFEASVDWGDQLLLGGAGWVQVSRHGQSASWVRPGKNPRDGISATTGRDANRDRLYVFSTSTEFPTEQPLTKFGAFAILHHGGDHRAAAMDLHARGFGGRHGGEGGLNSVPDFVPGDSIDGESSYTLDDLGGTKRLADYVDGNYVWVVEEDTYYMWDGAVWAPDKMKELSREFFTMTENLLASPDEQVRKWAIKSRGSRISSFIVKNMNITKGVCRLRSSFDRHRGVLNLRNGVLNLHTGEFGPHRRELYQTRMFGAGYDPEAQCPRFSEFIDQVLPDIEIQRYVQRAVGYSLLGEADQRALFLVWGPSGTGKSQFLECLQHLFGDYAATASPGTFMAKRDGSHSSDVHRLRGRRFVATSETADNTRFDEEVVKRITGQDTMTTRTLYQKEQEWVPECVVWIATNHKPRFTSDDDAIWRRSKLLPFQTRFGVEGGPRAITGFARRFLFPEASGILNWALEGLAEFMRIGLAEPDSVGEESRRHRQEVDPVATFLDEQISDGYLVVEELGRILTNDLYRAYSEWCHVTGERPLLRRRFLNRLAANMPELSWKKIGGRFWVTGLSRSVHLSVGGQFMLAANDN